MNDTSTAALADLSTLRTADLVRLAHRVASLLRERAFQDAPEAQEEARAVHAALVAAADEGVLIGALKAVLIRF